MTLTSVHGPQDLQRDIQEALTESEQMVKKHLQAAEDRLDGILTILSERQNDSWSSREVDQALDTMEERLMVICGRFAISFSVLINSWRYCEEDEDEEE